MHGRQTANEEINQAATFQHCFFQKTLIQHYTFYDDDINNSKLDPGAAC